MTMTMTKTVTGYVIGKPENSYSLTDIQHLCVTVFELNTIDPGEELLEASRYKDHSLATAQKKVVRMRELGLTNWYDTRYSGARLTFSLQGGIADQRYYAWTVESFEPTDENLKLLSQIKKAIGKVGYGSDYRDSLIKALLSIKGVEVTRDKEGDFYYPVPTREREYVPLSA